jgi:hypothetical protein
MSKRARALLAARAELIRLTIFDGAADRYVNGVNGMSDIEGKAAREAVSECGQRASFNRSVSGEFSFFLSL